MCVFDLSQPRESFFFFARRLFSIFIWYIFRVLCLFSFKTSAYRVSNLPANVNLIRPFFQHIFSVSLLIFIQHACIFVFVLLCFVFISTCLRDTTQHQVRICEWILFCWVRASNSAYETYKLRHIHTLHLWALRFMHTTFYRWLYARMWEWKT